MFNVPITCSHRPTTQRRGGYQCVITKTDMSDTTDDMEYGSALLEAQIEAREKMWRNGLHVDRKGKTWKLQDMTEFHLRMTIKYFDWLDVSPLKKELKKRKCK